MKECPFCKAQIEDNARFCLYCMKPLTEKEIIPPQKKDMRWLFAVAALTMAVVVILLLPDRKPVKPQKPSAATPVSTGATTAQTEMLTTGPTADSMQESTGKSAAEPTDNVTSTENIVISATEMPAGSIGATATKPGTKPGTKPATKTTAEPNAPTTAPVAPATKATTGPAIAATTQPATSSVGAPTTKPTVAPTTKPTAKPLTKPTTVPTTIPTTKPTTKATTAPEETTIPEEPDSQVVYTYRAANAGDDHTGITVNPANDIVITGVQTPAADGVYRIPSYIDGKRVVAIGYIAFNPLDVKEVILGETIRNVNQNAFIGCYNISKFYVTGDTLYISRSAFTDATRRNCTLTFYASEQCLDVISGGYLKDAVSKYRAQWEEWDGSL